MCPRGMERGGGNNPSLEHSRGGKGSGLAIHVPSASFKIVEFENVRRKTGILAAKQLTKSEYQAYDQFSLQSFIIELQAKKN